VCGEYGFSPVQVQAITEIPTGGRVPAVQSNGPQAKLIKNSHLNYNASTERIEKIKHAPESYNLQLSGEPKNAKQSEE
jgi:hypothetical protein